MFLQWVANIDRSLAKKHRNYIESYSGNTCLIGRPFVTGPWSILELEVMNLVGIYMEVQEDKIEPDPDCLVCSGSGVIVLFTSTSPCECLKRKVNVDDTDIFDSNKGSWE